MQFLIRERMRGMPAPNTIKSRGALLLELSRELRDLREELEERRYGKYFGFKIMRLNNKNGFLEKDIPEPARREIPQQTLPAAELPKHQQRPSLISLFTGSGTQAQPSHGSSIQIDSRSGTAIGTPSDTLSQHTLHPPRCESLSSSSTTTNKEPSDSHSGDCPTPTPSPAYTGSATLIAGGGSSPASTIGHGHASHLSHSMSLQQSWKVTQPRLRFVSSVEFRHSSGETSTTPLSPESPIDDSSGEAQRPSRLQRSKAQSRKTFRLRRGRQNHGETISHSAAEAQAPEPTPPKTNVTDVSWDSVSQTSSTSGYRDNYSFQTSLLSPDGSLTGTAPLTRSPSQHSLLMLFEAQDEDTLI